MSFEEEVRRLWDLVGGNLVPKLEILRRGLESWAKKIKDTRNGLKTELTQKLEMLLEEKMDDENLCDLIDTKIQLKVSDRIYGEG